MATGGRRPAQIIAVAGKTCGLGLYPHHGWRCVDMLQAEGDNSNTGSAAGLADTDSPFGPDWVVSIGFVAVLVPRPPTPARGQL